MQRIDRLSDARQPRAVVSTSIATTLDSVPADGNGAYTAKRYPIMAGSKLRELITMSD